MIGLRLACGSAACQWRIWANRALLRHRFQFSSRAAASKPILYESDLRVRAGGPSSKDVPAGSISSTAPPKALLSLGLSEAVTRSMAALGAQSPTLIQKIAIPRLLGRESTLIAAETGTGKTLAYLAPLVTLLKNTDPLWQRKPRRPRMIVLVPTRELVVQVLAVTKSLTRTSRLSAGSAVGGGPRRRSMRKALEESPIDILVATPGMLSHMREEKLIHLSELEALVIDEADVTLAARGFEEQVAPFLRAVDSKPTLVPPQKVAQYVYVAATVSGAVKSYITSRHSVRDSFEKEPLLGELAIAKTDKLHVVTPPDQVQTTFIRIAGGETTKLQRAADIVCRELRQKGSKKIMVFCDHENRRSELVDSLRDSRGVDVVHMSRNADRMDRWQDWKEFCNNPDVRVAVCAQSFSRGIDNSDIGTVILTDVPFTGGEYLHRIGRIRGKGRAFVLVTNRDRAVSQALFLAHVRGDDLSSLNASTAWNSFTNAGYSRIRNDPAVLLARRAGIAFWIDEGDGEDHSSQNMSSRERLSGRSFALRRNTFKSNRASQNMPTRTDGAEMRSSNALRRREFGRREFSPNRRAERYIRRRSKDAGPYGG